MEFRGKFYILNLLSYKGTECKNHQVFLMVRKVYKKWASIIQHEI
jgi:hypothetical protein